MFIGQLDFHRTPVLEAQGKCSKEGHHMSEDPCVGLGLSLSLISAPCHSLMEKTLTCTKHNDEE